MNTYLIWAVCGCFMTEKATGQHLPGKPTNIQVLADSINIGVQWNPPNETSGTIKNYIVKFAVLPNTTESSSKVDGQTTIALIPVETHVGRVFRIRVSAKNDVGIGPYSDVRYIRISCQRTIEIFPNTSLRIRSPGYLSRDPLEAGVMCSWQLKTNIFYVIRITFENLNLIKDRSSTDGSSCLDSTTFVEIEGIAKYCDLDDETKTVVTISNDLNLTLRTGMAAGGHGFALTADSVMHLPGPPTHIHLSTTNHAIEVTWQKPIENTLPLTSFIIRYRILSSAQSFMVTVSPGMRRFYLNTEPFEGQLMSINMSAAISFQEGLQSKPVFIRAPCQRQYYINTGNSVNISSPNYPSPYPRNVLCTWEVITDPEVNLLITVTDFQLEDSPFCYSDYVLFSFNEKKQKECTRLRIPSTVSIGSSTLNLTFASNAKKQFQGFMLYIQAQGKTTIPLRISSTTNQQSRNLYSSKESYLIPFFTQDMQKTTPKSDTLGNVIPSQKYHPTTLLETVRPTKSILLNKEGRRTPPSGNSKAVTTEESRHKSNTVNSRNTVHTTDLTVSVTGDASVTQLTDHADIHGFSSPNLYIQTNTAFPRIKADFKQITDTSEQHQSMESNSLERTDGTLQRRNSPTTPDNGYITQTVTALQHDSTNFTSILQKHEEANSSRRHVTTVDKTIWSISAFAFVMAVLIGLLICKRRRRNSKIHIDRSGSNRSGHIELHDIVNLSRKPSNSYEIFEVSRTQPRQFTNSKTGKNVTNGVTKEATNVYPVSLKSVKRKQNTSLRQERRQYGNPDENKVNGERQGENVYHSPIDTIPKRHFSLPSSTKQIQIFREVKRTVAAFDFIEDKDKLEKQITRKMQRKRMNSL